MKSKTVQRLLDSTPRDIEIFVDWYTALVVRINQILTEKNVSKKELAEKMGKKPSEISKWLNGEHNFTIRSLAKLSAELGEPLMEVPQKNFNKDFIEDGYICKIHSFVSHTKIDTRTKEKIWLIAEQSEKFNELNNAG